MVIFGSISYRRAGKPTEAKEMLELAAKRSNTNSWPYRVISYLRGELTPDTLASLAAGSNDRLTEAHGYIGLDLLLKDQKDAAVTHLKWVKEHGNPNFVEYIFSTIELNRLENGKQ
jgi:lipoprotein NlpI